MKKSLRMQTWPYLKEKQVHSMPSAEGDFAMGAIVLGLFEPRFIPRHTNGIGMDS